MFGLNKYLIVVAAVSVALFTTYFFWSQWTISKQSKELLAYEITVQSQQHAIDQLTDDVEIIKDINKVLSAIEREAATNASDLADKLSGLERIADAKPGIVEDLINAAAKARVRCFALATGAIPLENEANKTCPHLLRGK